MSNAVRTAALPAWTVTEEKTQEAVRRIVTASNPVKVILFGSRARKTGHVDSDLDLMVVLSGVRDPIAESVRLRRLLKGLIMAVDILVVDQEKFDYWRETPGNVFYEAAHEGKIVYEGG